MIRKFFIVFAIAYFAQSTFFSRSVLAAQERLNEGERVIMRQERLLLEEKAAEAQQRKDDAIQADTIQMTQSSALAE